MKNRPDPPVRIGIIGCGRIGTAHALALNRIGGACLAGVIDNEPERAGAVAEKYGVRMFDSVDEMMTCETVDAVIIAVPTHQHAPLAIRAAATGKHILCEKPMAMTTGECDAMLQAAAASGVILVVGHDLRFSTHYRQAKAAIDGGEVGKPLALSAERLSGASATTWRGWIRRAGEGLGAFDALIHDLDVALWFLGPTTALSALGTRGPGGTWDHIQVLLKHEDACSSLIEASLMVPPSFSFTSSIRVVGEGGTLIRRFVGGRTFSDHGVDSGLVLYRGDSTPTVLVPPAPAGQAALERELQAFVHAVQTGHLPDEARPEAARAALSLVEQTKAALDGQAGSELAQ